MLKPPPGFEWDEAKAASNWRKHGVSFADAEWFELATSIELEDANLDQTEPRATTLGKIGRNLHVFVYTQRRDKIRVISLRKATAPERRFYIEVKGY